MNMETGNPSKGSGHPTSPVLSLSTFRARRALEEGHEHISQGRIEEALVSFQKSAQSEPTAEALTYWAWMLSFKGDLEKCIELCKQAILLDEEFGNPYNDIGSYLIRLGRHDEAIPWLERAKTALKYEPKHFPFINLGRVYVAQGLLEKAKEQFKMALNLSPGNAEIIKVIKELDNEIQDHTNSL
jgi:Tfp pilus assembly protein PilF